MKTWVIYFFVFTVVIAYIVLVSSINLDLNHDGSINLTDLQLLASHYEGKMSYNSSFDLNNDSKIDLFDVVKVAKDINVSSNGPGINNTIQPAFEEDWNYTNTSNMQSNPNGWFSSDSLTSGGASIELDTGLTTPWGGTKALKIQFYAGSCSSNSGYGVQAGKNIAFPTSDIPNNTREIWVEAYTKFGAGWKTNFNCSGNPDHKWMFYTETFYGGQGRWETKIGTYGSDVNVAAGSATGYGTGGNGAPLDDYEARVPPDTGTPINASQWFWDGKWHVVRVHLKQPDPNSSNGIFQESIDGTTVVNRTGFTFSTNPSTGGWRGLALGRNLNQYPNQNQSFWFGRVRVWDQNPGWDF